MGVSTALNLDINRITGILPTRRSIDARQRQVMVAYGLKIILDHDLASYYGEKDKIYPESVSGDVYQSGVCGEHAAYLIGKGFSDDAADGSDGCADPYSQFQCAFDS